MCIRDRTGPKVDYTCAVRCYVELNRAVSCVLQIENHAFINLMHKQDYQRADYTSNYTKKCNSNTSTTVFHVLRNLRAIAFYNVTQSPPYNFIIFKNYFVVSILSWLVQWISCRKSQSPKRRGKNQRLVWVWRPGSPAFGAESRSAILSHQSVESPDV